jgi:hypothetical protein
VAHRVARLFAGGLIAIVVLLLLLVGGIYVAGRIGVGSERLRLAAEETIQSAVGVDVETSVGSTRLMLSGTRLVAIEARDVKIVRADTAETVLSAGRIRFGLKLMPLLHGRVVLGSASIADARIAPADLRPTGNQHWNAALRNPEGLFDPSLISEAVFGAMHRTFDFVEKAGTRRLKISNVVLSQSWRGLRADLTISELVVQRPASGEISFTGNAELAGRAISIDGKASRNDAGAIRDLSARFSVSRKEPNAGEARTTPEIGSFELAVEGSETGRQPGRLVISADMQDTVFDLESQGRAVASAEIRAALSRDSKTLSIERAHVKTGRSDFDFRGVMGPLAGTDQNRPPAYGFELFSARSVVAPTDSPEPAPPLVAHIAGHYEPDTRRLTADVVDVRTSTGQMSASASMTLAPGMTPGLTLAISSAGMDTGQLKQLWPWFAAHGPREWVLGHVFGGRITEGSIRLAVPPGRFGNGVALSADEVSGHFKIENTRFDVAGRMPPVRDGDGVIDFAGTDVKINLSAGAVYMPGGKVVTATGGTFTINDANVAPRIGQLEIDIEGDAPAVLQLASYDPINASRFIDFKPEDLSGEVKGHVSADIPLEPDAPSEGRRWKVSLSYKNLALAKPVAGQMVTDADGTIVLQPDSADIDAKAKLNGTEATIHMVEPLGGSDVERKQEIQLTLDDAARERLAPGLSAILSGTAKVDLEMIGKDQRRVKMDLQSSVLSVPWVGWQKGAGVAATASFVMKTEGERITISDFQLAGDSFGATGQIELAGGKLASATFSNASLNRGDDFSVDIDRQGNTYAVKVRGASFDARSVIKRFSSTGSGKEGGGSGGGETVKLDAKLDRVSGFADVALSNVDVSYSGSGAASSQFEATAVTPGKGKVSATQTAKDGSRSIVLQSSEAGAVLGFLDIYPHMSGGSLDLQLDGATSGGLSGTATLRDFWIVDEPRLGSLAAAAPSGGGGMLNQGSQAKIDTQRVKFDVGFARIEKGAGYLKLQRGVLRGPSVGATFQGTLYDPNGNIAMTGTFMPVYGVNRIFGEIPLIGQILGNGRDRGLIAVTYPLTVKTAKPQLEINPISAIAPGILRQIFEFH